MKKQSWWARLLGHTTTSSSAAIAKDRLTVLVASNNNQLKTRLTPDRIEQMKREIAAVVSRYVSGLNDDSININHRKEDSMDVLEMNISLPDLIKGVEDESDRLSEKQAVQKPSLSKSSSDELVVDKKSSDDNKAEDKQAAQKSLDDETQKEDTDKTDETDTKSDE